LFLQYLVKAHTYKLSSTEMVDKLFHFRFLKSSYRN